MHVPLTRRDARVLDASRLALLATVRASSTRRAGRSSTRTRSCASSSPAGSRRGSTSSRTSRRCRASCSGSERRPDPPTSAARRGNARGDDAQSSSTTYSRSSAASARPTRSKAEGPLGPLRRAKRPCAGVAYWAQGPVAQWIERRTSNPRAEVRFLPGPSFHRLFTRGPPHRRTLRAVFARGRSRVGGWTMQRLVAIPLFASVVRAQFSVLAGCAGERAAYAGEMLVTEGEFGHCLFAIESGTADATQDGEAIRGSHRATSSARSRCPLQARTKCQCRRHAHRCGWSPSSSGTSGRSKRRAPSSAPAPRADRHAGHARDALAAPPRRYWTPLRCRSRCDAPVVRANSKPRPRRTRR